MTQTLKRVGSKFLYQQVIEMILELKTSSTLRPGDKLPSLRKLSKQLSISIPTVKLAYTELEKQRVIEARPKSGYFMKTKMIVTQLPQKANLSQKPTLVNKQTLIEQVYDALHSPNMVSMGIANPSTANPCDMALARVMRQVLTKAGAKAISYGSTTGYPPLKRQLALRYFDYGILLNPEEILITNGAQEALSIALQCVAKTGDVIAVESPAYFGVLELIESLGMLALEIPLCPEDGVCLIDVASAIKDHPVKACLVSTSVSNPIGSFMPDNKRKELVKLLEDNHVPLIEDDVYGDLYFTEKRGVPAQCFSTKGLVLTCSSFSKTVAPGYRVGWLVTGQYINKAKRIKRATTCSNSLISQWTLAEFISGSEYDRNMQKLRDILKQNKCRMMARVQQKFPNGTKVSNPMGGGVLWIELPNEIDSETLFVQAIKNGISIAPGSIFSASKKFKNCIRISYGMPWTTELESAIDTLAELVSDWAL